MSIVFNVNRQHLFFSLSIILSLSGKMNDTEKNCGKILKNEK